VKRKGCESTGHRQGLWEKGVKVVDPQALPAMVVAWNREKKGAPAIQIDLEKRSGRRKGSEENLVGQGDASSRGRGERLRKSSSQHLGKKKGEPGRAIYTQQSEQEAAHENARMRRRLKRSGRGKIAAVVCGERAQRGETASEKKTVGDRRKTTEVKIPHLGRSHKRNWPVAEKKRHLLALVKKKYIGKQVFLQKPPPSAKGALTGHSSSGKTPHQLSVDRRPREGRRGESET